MISFSISQDSNVSYICSLDKKKKPLKVMHGNIVELKFLAIEISLGEEGKNTFLVGFASGSCAERCSIVKIRSCKLELPTGTKIMTDTGIPVLTIEPLEVILESGNTIMLFENTILYDKQANVEVVLKKRCKAKVHSFIHYMLC